MMCVLWICPAGDEDTPPPAQRVVTPFFYTNPKTAFEARRKLMYIVQQTEVEQAKIDLVVQEAQAAGKPPVRYSARQELLNLEKVFLPRTYSDYSAPHHSDVQHPTQMSLPPLQWRVIIARKGYFF